MQTCKQTELEINSTIMKVAFSFNRDEFVMSQLIYNDTLALCPSSPDH